jgi:hypothetical protein
VARLLVLTDRLDSDPDWKGAVIWQTIMSLAESQHEVLVATPLSLEYIQQTHPRLTVIQPIRSWRVDQLPRLIKTILSYQPQVIHSFALQPSRTLTPLTVWPYLTGMCKALPGVRRVSTFFEVADCARRDPSFLWHQSCSIATAFSEAHRQTIALELDRPATRLPLELQSLSGAPATRLVIPAAVSEWQNPTSGLQVLRRRLEENSAVTALVIGGWGDCSPSQRKAGWSELQELGARVKMCAPLSYSDLLEELRQGGEILLDLLPPRSWRYLLISQLLNVNAQGSTANSISRIYSAEV